MGSEQGWKGRDVARVAGRQFAVKRGDPGGVVGR